ncbi:MAG: hypothetical protein IKN85_10390 [Oscillospiraceae bacterium]|nr:hypothetical protein [Oscillospiraceae bacterium]MBR3536222.1 hypothetical protein [Oscillospiraceae bacterium]
MTNIEKHETEVKVINQEQMKSTVKLREIIVPVVITVFAVWFAFELIDYLMCGASNSKFDYILLGVTLISAVLNIFHMLRIIKDYIGYD